MKEEYFTNLARTEDGFSEVRYAGEKKKIFLIGDSICRGYRVFVEENLKDKYDVVYPEENCRNSQYILTTLRTWVNAFENTDDVVLVSFNCGHWDIAHWNGDEESLTSIDEYIHNLKRIIKQLRTFFPKAELLFFTTSPMWPEHKMEPVNPRSNREIESYNNAALEIVEGNGIFAEDIYSFMRDWDGSNYIDYVHLTQDANRILGKYVTDNILKILEQEGE